MPAVAIGGAASLCLGWPGARQFVFFSSGSAGWARNGIGSAKPVEQIAVAAALAAEGGVRRDDCRHFHCTVLYAPLIQTVYQADPHPNPVDEPIFA